MACSSADGWLQYRLGVILVLYAISALKVRREVSLVGALVRFVINAQSKGQRPRG